MTEQQMNIFAATARFDHAHIFCSDLEASERWFSEVLGAEVYRRPTKPGQPVTAVAAVGGLTFLLRPLRDDEVLQEAIGQYFGLDHVGFLVPDIIAAVADLKSRGASVTDEPTELRPGVWVAFIEGPDQLRIEILQK
ncbi:MAG: VOC family protein [Propionibacteriaceae bacterium]|nr:VOC family protein [Propionibacteriaceae bacterium]